MIVGAAIAGAAFYLINRYNENEQKEALAELIKSLQQSKASSNALKDAVNDPKASLVVEKALNIIITGEGYYYYQDQDCSNMQGCTLDGISSIIANEKSRTKEKELMILIKEKEGASFKQSVELLDQITKAGIAPGHFAQIELSEKEKNCIQHFKEK